MAGPAPLVSVVIPTLDEERALPATLRSVLDQPVALEAIVADGASSDGTRRVVEDEVARDGRLRLLRSPRRGRAAQMNAGAAIAGGEWLLFLHADTLLPDAALTRIAKLPPEVRAGCFAQRFSGDNRLLRLLSWLHNRRFQVTRVIYGDQALFVRRELFDALGGFPERPMEDIAFGLALRRTTTPRMLPMSVVTDARKFDRLGHWRALGRAILLLVRFRLGADVAGDPFFTPVR